MKFYNNNENAVIDLLTVKYFYFNRDKKFIKHFGTNEYIVLLIKTQKIC